MDKPPIRVPPIAAEAGNLKSTRPGRRIDPHEIEWASQNLDLLQKYAYGDIFRYWALAIVFIAGGVVMFVAYLVAAGTIVVSPDWKAQFVVDALLNVGLAFISSALVVFLLEIFVDIQKRRSEQYLRSIQELLKYEALSENPSSPGGEAGVSGPEQT
jgi:hypothetical protein